MLIICDKNWGVHNYSTLSFILSMKFYPEYSLMRMKTKKMKCKAFVKMSCEHS